MRVRTSDAYPKSRPASACGTFAFEPSCPFLRFHRAGFAKIEGCRLRTPQPALRKRGEDSAYCIQTSAGRRRHLRRGLCRSVPRRRRPERPQGGLCRAGHARRDDRESLRACAPHCRHQERRLRPQACDRAHRPEGGGPGDQVRRWPADPAHARRHSRLRPLRGLAQYGRGDLYARLSGRGEDRDGKLRDQHAACLA